MYIISFMDYKKITPNTCTCMYVSVMMMYFETLMEKDRCGDTSKAFRRQRPLSSVIISDYNALCN